MILGIGLEIARDHHIVQKAPKQPRRTIQSGNEVTVRMAQAQDDPEQVVGDLERDLDELKTLNLRLENVNEI